jgi:hypothetical protein
MDARVHVVCAVHLEIQLSCAGSALSFPLVTMGQKPGKSGAVTNQKKAVEKIKIGTKAISHAKERMKPLSEEDSVHQHFHYRFRNTVGDPLLIPSTSTMDIVNREDKLSQVTFDAVLASEQKKGFDETMFVDTFADFFPGTQPDDKLEKRVFQIVFHAITRTAKTDVLTHQAVEVFLDTIEPLPKKQRATRVRELRGWFAQNVDQGLDGQLNNLQFYQKMQQIKADNGDLYERMFGGLMREKATTFGKTKAEECLYFEEGDPAEPVETNPPAPTEKASAEPPTPSKEANANSESKEHLEPPSPPSKPSSRPSTAEGEEYTITFQEGPLGLKLGEDIVMGVHTIIVEALAPGGQAEQNEDICEGDVLTKVNGNVLDSSTSKEKVLALIGSSPRPMTLTFKMGPDNGSTDDEGD